MGSQWIQDFLCPACLVMDEILEAGRVRTPEDKLRKIYIFREVFWDLPPKAYSGSLCKVRKIPSSFRLVEGKGIILNEAEHQFFFRKPVFNLQSHTDIERERITSLPGHSFSLRGKGEKNKHWLHNPELTERLTSSYLRWSMLALLTYLTHVQVGLSFIGVLLN